MNRKWALVILAIFVALVIFAMIFLLMYLFSDEAPSTSPLAVITQIAAPTSTPVLLATFEPTITPIPTLSAEDKKGIYVTGYAQITGTAGDGLSIRSGPATTFAVNFIGLDAELFKVIDGPVEADGYTWWKVEAPYDTSRNGWCVDNYLSPVTAPEE